MASVQSIQTIRTIGDAAQIIGVSGVILDIYHARLVLGMRGLTKVVRDTIASVAASTKRWVRRIVTAVVRQFRARRSVTHQLSAHEGAVSSESASVELIRGRPDSLDATVDRLWEIVTKEHDAALGSLRADLAAERTARGAAIAHMASDLRREVGQVDTKLTRLAGEHHLRRLGFAVLIVMGLGLSLLADLLVS